MKTIKAMILITLTGFLFSCATTPIPTELSNARQAYQKASRGPAAQLAPVQLRKARLALDRAENAFAEAPESYQTSDLAYVAERKALQADAFASIASQKSDTIGANREYQTTQGEIIARSKEDAARAETRRIEAAAAQAADKLATEQQARRDAEKRANLAQAELAKVATEQQTWRDAEKRANLAQAELAKVAAEQQAWRDAEKRANLAQAELAKVVAEQQARRDAEKRANLAQPELAKVAALKEEARGLVITLSGSVVFASNQATLLPAAQFRLNHVAEALMSTGERRSLTVEGHTDATGSGAYNLKLSQRRADSVRSYLISRGYPAGLIEAQGIGEARPIADNSSLEGRSNNRRVEIIVQSEDKQQKLQSKYGGQE